MERPAVEAPKLNFGVEVSSAVIVGAEIGSAAAFIVSRGLLIAGWLPKVKVGMAGVSEEGPPLAIFEVEVPELNFGIGLSSTEFATSSVADFVVSRPFGFAGRIPKVKFGTTEVCDKAGPSELICETDVPKLKLGTEISSPDFARLET